MLSGLFCIPPPSRNLLGLNPAQGSAHNGTESFFRFILKNRLSLFTVRLLNQITPLEIVMHVQIINFSLNDLKHDAYSDACNDIAETFANLPGLISKHWIANPETNTYGGVYFWESKEDMENYLKSEVFEEVANNPAFADATSKDFAVLEGPTKITRGIT